MSDLVVTNARATSRPIMFGVIAIAAIGFPFLISSGALSWTGFPLSALFTSVNLALIACVGAAAFNLLVGYAGQISMAHAAMLMVGTMAAGWLSSRWNLNFLVLLPLVGVVGGVIGAMVALPALRLRGMYLLLATLAFHYIAGSFYHWFLPAYFGFVGIVFPPPVIGFGDTFSVTLDSDASWYWVLLAFASLSLFIMGRYVSTYEGRALAAIDARDKAAALLGINVARSKLVVFGISSAFVAMSGAVSGYFLGARVEDSFPVSVVLDFAVMIVVGGYASLAGGVVGAFFFYITPLFIQWLLRTLPVISDIAVLQKHYSSINLGLFGFLIVLILIRRPDGLAGLLRLVRRL